MTISIKELLKGYYKYCECNCGYLIPIINKMGEFARFKKGHNYKGKLNPNYGKNGMNSPCWKGGKSKQGEYIIIKKPYYKYSNTEGYVRKHRYIMYIYLSILNNKPTYIEGFDVHHKNNNTKDNRIENLELLTKSDHGKITVISNPKTIFKTIDKSNRFCNICKSKTTYKRLNKNGKYYDVWYNDINGFLCQTCHDHIRRYKK